MSDVNLVTILPSVLPPVVDPFLEWLDLAGIAVFALSGALVALARMFAQRRAAGYYAKSTGHLPPGLKKGDQ